MNSTNKKVALKLWVRVILLIFIIFMLSFGLIFIIKEFVSKPVNKETIYSYTIDRNMKYEVELFENSFIEEKVLGMNNTYMSDLVKNIKANFEYKLMGSNFADMSYNYTISATINGTYKLNNEYTDSKVWTKSYVLLESNNNNVTDNYIIINDNVDIDFHFYDNEVAQFRKHLKLPINATLSVVLNLNLSGKTSGQDFSDSSMYVINIPLNQQAFNITSSVTPESKEANSYNLYKITETNEINYENIIIGSILIILSTSLFICFFKKIFVFKKKYYYDIKRDKILKEYGEIIVEVAEPIDDEEFNIVKVKSFDEMIDLEEELRIPIMFYDYITEKKGDFVIMHNNCLYKFTLDDNKKKD